MTYKESDLWIIDGLDHIRNRPEMYVWGGRPYPVVLAARLVADVLVQPYHVAAAVRNLRTGGLLPAFATGSMRRWSPIDDYFKKVKPFTEAGPNALHAEAIITAFARDVVTFDESSRIIIQGASDEVLDRFRAEHPEWVRVVAFRM